MTNKLILGKNAVAVMAAAFIVSCNSGNEEPASTSVDPTPQSNVETQNVPTSNAVSYSPYVDAEGNISRPVNFLNDPDWTHIGAWAVVNENGEGNGIHNVYTTYDALNAFKATGAFPDGAVLVKEVLGADDANLTTGRAHWAADNAVWFVMVKDTQGRFEQNPLWGDGWGWALFEAADPAKQVATDYKTDCLTCHIPAKDTDWVYVQAYPVLGNN